MTKPKYNPEETLKLDIDKTPVNSAQELQDWLVNVLTPRDRATMGQHKVLDTISKALFGYVDAKKRTVPGLIDEVEANTIFRKDREEKERRLKWLVFGVGPIAVTFLGFVIKILLAKMGIKV